MVVQVGLVVAIALCAMMSLRASQLLHAVMWLAAASALLAVVLYLLGAREAAVIELSVGAGLVSVLLVVAISIAGEDTSRARSVIPRWLAAALAFGSILLLALLILPPSLTGEPAAEPSFAVMLWQERSADVLLQIGLIFVGLLTVLGLLAETPKAKPAPQVEITAVETAVVEPETAEEMLS